jgi:hypothetical protein
MLEEKEEDGWLSIQVGQGKKDEMHTKFRWISQHLGDQH